MDLFSSFTPLCVYMIYVSVLLLLEGGGLVCCIVIPQTSVQKSIEYKINKISLFIDSFSFSPSERLAVLVAFYECFLLCRVV